MQNFRQEMLNVTSLHAERSHEQIADSGAQVILDFIKNIRNQMNDIRATLGNSLNIGLGKKLDYFQNELDALQLKMDASFSALKTKAATDALSVEKIISAREAIIRSGLASLSKCAEDEFASMNQRLDRMEGSL